MIQSNKSYERKKKEIEKQNISLQNELEDQRSLCNELKTEFEIFEEKLLEFEHKESENIKTVCVFVNH